MDSAEEWMMTTTFRPDTRKDILGSKVIAKWSKFLYSGNISKKKDMLQSFQQVIFLRMLHYLLVITTFAIHSNKKRGAVWWHFIYLA